MKLTVSRNPICLLSSSLLLSSCSIPVGADLKQSRGQYALSFARKFVYIYLFFFQFKETMKEIAR